MDFDFPLKTRTLKYKGTLLEVYQDIVGLPNGNSAAWDVIDHKGAAAVIPVMDDGRILMVRQYRHAIGRYTLEIPAGGRNSRDEKTEDAAHRELEEETGRRAGSPDDLEFLIRVDTTVAFCDEEIDIFVAHNPQKSHQHLDEDEVINVEEWSLSDLLKKVYAGEIKDAKTVAALTAYALKTQKNQ